MEVSRDLFDQGNELLFVFTLFKGPLADNGVETGVRALRLMKGFDVQLPNKDTSPDRLLVFRLFRGLRFRNRRRLHLLAR